MRCSPRFTSPARRALNLLLTLFVLAAAACDEKDAGTPGDLEVTYATIDDFRARAGAGEGERQRVVFIGMDGASWDIMGPMIESGELPTLARLKAEGASGVLKSVPCYLSPPAWTSMFTGYSQEHTGIYTFGKWHQGRWSSVSSADVQVPSLWDAASMAGRRVAVTNVPMTYPARPVNGIMVTGLLTPFVFERDEKRLGLRLHGDERAAADFGVTSYSAPLSATITLSNNTLAVGLFDTTDDGADDHDTVALKIVPKDEDWRSTPNAVATTWSLGTYSPWITFDYVEPETRDSARVQASMRIDFGSGKGRAARANFAMLHVSPLFRVPSDENLDMTYPDSLAADLEADLGAYIINFNVDPQMIVEKVDDAVSIASYLYNSDDWDFFVYNFMSTDNIQHREGFSERARQVYRSIDRFLGELVAKLPDNTTLIVASDHGFAHYDYIIDLNLYLSSIGLVADADDPTAKETLVFHNQWCIYFNDELLSDHTLRALGIPAVGDSPREALIDYLRRELSELEDRRTGRRFPIELVEVPEDAAGIAPDMIVIGTYSDYFVEGPDLVSKRAEVATATVPDAPLYHDRGWFHDRDGIYVIWGKNVREGIDGGTRRIEDMTPTILYLMDVPLAEDFDGFVMSDILKPELTAQRRITYLRDYADLRSDIESPEELQTLQEKLRSLGYIR